MGGAQRTKSCSTMLSARSPGNQAFLSNPSAGAERVADWQFSRMNHARIASTVKVSVRASALHRRVIPSPDSLAKRLR